MVDSEEQKNQNDYRRKQEDSAGWAHFSFPDGSSKDLEAATGFEPVNGGFADLSLSHLGTPPPLPSIIGNAGIGTQMAESPCPVGILDRLRHFQ